jgi:hypothetical protein
MKTLIKWLLRLVLLLVVVVVLVVVGGIGLTMTESFVKGVVLPMVSDKTPYRVTLTQWRFRPWSSLSIRGLVVKQKNVPAGQDSTIAEVRGMDAHYSLASFLRKHPVLDSLEIDTPVIGLTGARAQAQTAPYEPGAGQPTPAPAPKPTPTPAPGKPAKAGRPPALNALALPFTARSVRISNAEFSYQDHTGLRVNIRDMNLNARDLGPSQRGAVDLAGVVTYVDGKDVAIERLPLALNAQCSLSEKIMPTALVANMAVSNVRGRVGTMDLRSLATTVNLAVQSPDAKQFTVERAAAQVDWMDQALAHVLITGRFNVQQITADGSVNAAMRPSPLWQMFVPKKAGVDISGTRADVNLMVNAAEKGQTLTTKGTFNVQDLKLVPPKASSQGIAPLSMTGALNASLDQRDKSFVLPQLTMNISQRNAQVVTLRTESPVSLSWAPAGTAARTRDENARVRLDITKLALPQLNAFLGSDKTSINDGLLSANLVCDVANRGERIGVQGTIAAEDLELRSGKSQWRKLTIKSQIATELESMALVNLRKMSAETLLNDRPAGTLAAGGFYDMRAGSNRLALAVAKMSSELVRPVLDPQNKNRRLDGLLMTLQALTENSAPKHKPQDVGINMTIDNPARRSAGEWDELVWNAHATVSPKEALIDACTVRVSPAAWQDNQLALKGTIQFKPGPTPSQIELTSTRFDATVLLDTFMPAKGGATRANLRGSALPWDLDTLSAAAGVSDVVRAQPAARAAAATEPAAIDLKGRDANLLVRCNELRARELVLRPLALDLSVKDNIAMLVSRNVRLNDGDLRLNANANLGVPGFTYTATAFATNVPLRPLVNTFVPEKRDKTDGLIALDLVLRGAGVTKPSLQKNLTGAAVATLEDGTLFNPPILSEVGRTLQIPSLQVIKLADANVPVTVKDGFITFNNARLTTSSLAATLRGTIDLDQRLDMLIFLGLSGTEIINICSAFGVKMPLTKELDRIYNIPVPIPVRGTLSKPAIQTTYQKFLTEIIKSVGMDPTGLLRGVLDIIPQGKARDTVDDGLKLLEGLFNKKK